MKYTISQFNKDFPDDNACLNYIFNARFNGLKCPNCGKKAFYRVNGRKSFACSCGYQINPTANTIFRKSDTKLKDWFFALYLFSVSKNGVSAKELQRHLGTTYKTAWRIGSKIRGLMKQDSNVLKGTLEADEFYYGGKRKPKTRWKNKQIVMGVVERGGKVKSKHIPDAQTHNLLGMLRENVKFGSYLMTDDNVIYRKVPRLGLFHDKVNHSKEEYVRGDIHTNTIEGFWSQIKRSLWGTYVWVSPQHLQSYIDEFSYHYNHRSSCFHDLLGRLCGQPYQEENKMPSFVDIPVS